MGEKPELLHDVDKRLAVMEAVALREAAQNGMHRSEVKEQLADIKKSVDSLKIRVAGFSAGISILAFFLAQFAQGYFK